MTKQDYTYALNSENQIVSIKDAIIGHDYRCPFCESTMIQRKGEIRKWHFAHKSSLAVACSYESYLHKLAIIKIRQAFLSSKQFLLSYNAKAICPYECPFVGYPKCGGEKPVEFDLRKFYDTCEIEVPYKQYRADLLLTSSTNPKIPPILIEIMVTHKCTTEKIKDGVRIIEIPIQSEEQIDDIINHCKLSAIRSNQFNYNNSTWNKIILHNFNKVEAFDPVASINEITDYFSRKNTIVFWLNKQGQFRSFDCHCYEVIKKLPPNVHYYASKIATPFKEILQEFSKRGVKIRNCFLCKFSKQDLRGDRLCVLYKKHNLPRKPSPYYAATCPHYTEDIESSQNMGQIEQTLPFSLRSQFYYHICDDIL